MRSSASRRTRPSYNVTGGRIYWLLGVWAIFPDSTLGYIIKSFLTINESLVERGLGGVWIYFCYDTMAGLWRDHGTGRCR